MSYEEVRTTAKNIINSFPIAENNKPYLTLKNGQKIFFEIFMRKYGLKWSQDKYTLQDVWEELDWLSTSHIL